MEQLPRLKLLPYGKYQLGGPSDPLRFYYWPVLGALYRRRVELCLGELRGGERVLEVGFGSGVSFLNLRDLYREIHGLDLEASVEAVSALFRSLGVKVYLQNGDVLDMPYADDFFDAVLSISILEHLKPEQLPAALREIRRVLKPGGQVVYGVPVERPLMTLMFRLLGYNIHEHHFSTEKDVAAAASKALEKVHILQMRSFLRSPVYEVGHFVKR